MATLNFSPEDYKSAWGLLKARLLEKTSWGKNEILSIMATIESLLYHQRKTRLGHDSRKRRPYGKKED